jgi:hypothetical protein
MSTKTKAIRKCGICFFTGVVGVSLVGLCLIILAAFGRNGIVAASSLAGEGTWTTYTTAHGLPSNNVWGGVVVDGNGHVWAGFENGNYGDPPIKELISRWDGVSWTTYEIPGCRVMALAAQGDHVYAGTYCPSPPTGAGGGLSWFVDDTWVNFTPGDGMAGTYISAIAPEGDTKVWVAAGYSYLIYNYINLLDHKGTADKADDEWVLYEPDACPCDIRAIALDPEGNRWFGTWGSGVLVFDADSSHWLTYTTNVISSAWDIAFDAEGNRWFTAGSSVSRFDGTTWTYYPTREAAIEANFEAIMSSFNRQWLYSVTGSSLWAVEDSDGVWIKHYDQQLGGDVVQFYDGQSWASYTPANSGLGGGRVYGIAVDQQKNIWFATERWCINCSETGGVSQFTPQPDLILQIAPKTFLVEADSVALLEVNINVLHGLIPTISLTIADLPPDTFAHFTQNQVLGDADVQLTLTTTTATPFGVYPLRITAVGSTITRTSTVTMHVVPEIYRGYLPAIIQEE